MIKPLRMKLYCKYRPPIFRFSEMNLINNCMNITEWNPKTFILCLLLLLVSCFHSSGINKIGSNCQNKYCMNIWMYRYSRVSECVENWIAITGCPSLEKCNALISASYQEWMIIIHTRNKTSSVLGNQRLGNRRVSSLL